MLWRDITSRVEQGCCPQWCQGMSHSRVDIGFCFVLVFGNCTAFLGEIVNQVAFLDKSIEFIDDDWIGLFWVE